MYLYYILPWAYLFLLHVKILDDDTDEEVQSEKWADDYKEYKEEVIASRVVVHRLLLELQKAKYIQVYDEGALMCIFLLITYIRYIHRIGHDLDPSLKGCLGIKKR